MPSCSVGIRAQIPKTCRFGILGCADIARKFCQSVSDSSNAVVHAVASRSPEKAQRWVQENCPGAIAFDSYEALLEDKSVQAVYLPLPTGIRAEWALKAISKGKHILTEKPVGVSAEEAATIIQACRAAGVQYMDDTMFMHHVRTQAMRKALDEEAFGPPRLVASSFSVCFDSEEALQSNIRAQAANEPLGCIGDLGW